MPLYQRETQNGQSLKTNSRIRFHQFAFYYLCLAFVFMMPVFGRILPLLIALMALNWLIEGSYIRIFPALLHEKNRLRLLSFSLFYLLYILGLLYSDNMNYGCFDVQVKLSLLAFPLIFSTTDKHLFTRVRINALLLSYIAGCLAGSFLFFGHAWYNTLHSGLTDSFYYSNLSWYFHPSYLSMYYSFAIATLIWLLIENHRHIHAWITITGSFLILLFFIFIILLSSKAGLLGLASVLIFWFLILILKKKQWKLALSAVLISILAFYLGLKIFPFASERISQAKESLQSVGNQAMDPKRKSTSDRIEIWKAASVLIGKHFIFGVGTGDVKDELLKEYQNENIVEGFQKKMNAHNQYLQTFVALGLAGFLLLVLMLVLPSLIAFKDENYLYFSFLLIFALNIAVESMLETQAGVIFYAFFNTFFFTAFYCSSPPTNADPAH